ncbi:hypothetical protein CDD82_2434 [Ophiocordyceps australis]|uniref:Glycosyltransferase 2-like domain-containing protein n=1 Tax=Ophiocordyceps australis TaxID=1399860 RepID=A0A2C5X7F7_9HYPO|nr:hypothetical protein CDD82_2434 [Ophiocordyceps australis]
MDHLSPTGLLGWVAVDVVSRLSPLPGLAASTRFWAILFGVLWVHRYTRLLVHCVSHWSYKSKPLADKPSFTADDVTVIIPTIHHDFEQLRESLGSILRCRPAELVLVTTHDKVRALRALTDSLDSLATRISVLDTAIANKRLQVCEALPRVTTAITIMADDDVTWPPQLVRWILAPFEDEAMGGVGTCQRVRRERDGRWQTAVWNWLGAAYIERRNFEVSATHNMDGGTSCMSGRTGAYRTSILTEHAFVDGFKTEKWRHWTLNADDDNFVTRWLVNHGWKTWVQYSPECEVETTLEHGAKFLFQCTRWARSNWRSNWTSLVRERTVWRRQPWCTYALHIATFTSLAFVVDPLLLWACWRAFENEPPRLRCAVFVAQLAFMFLFTKTVKLWGLLWKHPSDLVYLPVSVLFGWFHGFIKLYALATLNMTSWGSRADGDANDQDRLTRTPHQNSVLATPPGHSHLVQFNKPPARPNTGSLPTPKTEKFLEKERLFAKKPAFFSWP